jgi:dehydrogenase/reductase SDR family protein 12
MLQVNNAGCMVNTREVDEDGLEKNFATNVLGTYLLSMGLLRMIEQ